MAIVLGALLGIGALFLWLTGHWFGWVLAFLPAAWLFQISTGDFHDPWAYVVGRLMISAAVTGIPHLLWSKRPY